jgi:hypothetical protein
MTFVGSGVDGDAVGAIELGVYGCFEDVGVVTAAAVAEGGEFIDVDGELCHGTKLRLGREYKKMRRLLRVRIQKNEAPEAPLGVKTIFE